MKHLFDLSLENVRTYRSHTYDSCAATEELTHYWTLDEFFLSLSITIFNLFSDGVAREQQNNIM